MLPLYPKLLNIFPINKVKYPKNNINEKIIIKVFSK